MLHVDFNWDCGPDGIVLDEDFNTDKLGWRSGDLFRLSNVNGKQVLEKIDPLEAFIRGYSNEGRE